jgi:hypothetical protein
LCAWRCWPAPSAGSRFADRLPKAPIRERHQRLHHIGQVQLPLCMGPLPGAPRPQRSRSVMVLAWLMQRSRCSISARCCWLICNICWRRCWRSEGCAWLGAAALRGAIASKVARRARMDRGAWGYRWPTAVGRLQRTARSCRIRSVASRRLGPMAKAPRSPCSLGSAGTLFRSSTC